MFKIYCEHSDIFFNDHYYKSISSKLKSTKNSRYFVKNIFLNKNSFIFLSFILSAINFSYISRNKACIFQ